MLQPRMKTTHLLAAIGALALSGCALLSADDRDFYGKGWVNPKELDDPAPKTPAHPKATGLPGRAPLVDPILDE